MLDCLHQISFFEQSDLKEELLVHQQIHRHDDGDDQRNQRQGCIDLVKAEAHDAEENLEMALAFSTAMFLRTDISLFFLAYLS